MPRIILISILFLASACTETEPPATVVAGRWYTAEQVLLGRGLYQEHCAICHAADGSATADWRTPGADGNYPPPPLNGTAHTWHHALALLDDMIANGGMQFGGVMPGFSSVLGKGDRMAIVAWFQNLWPDSVYQKWREIDSRSR